MNKRILEALSQARAQRRGVAVVTALSSGAQWLVEPGRPGVLSGASSQVHAPPAVAEIEQAVAQALRKDRSGICEVGGVEYFLHVHNPPLRMFIVGAVHIAQALAPMAHLAGFAVTVIDPRRAFATSARFPHIQVDPGWPDEVLTVQSLDERAAVVTLSHDPKIDDPALRLALGGTPFYIGCLGSRRTHAGRVSRLREAGFDDHAIDRLHAPIGLDIGAVSPAEIATAIMAEVVVSLRREPSPVTGVGTGAGAGASQ